MQCAYFLHKRKDTLFFDTNRENDMANLIKNILAGVRQVLVLWPDSQYTIPNRDGFQKDAKILRGDARKVAADLRKTVTKYGEQIHNR